MPQLRGNEPILGLNIISVTDRDIKEFGSMMTNHANIGDVSTQFKVPTP
jgi:hypothetical protein